jgi:hypothetical protein
MTLIALGLLLGMAGLLWVAVVDIMRADRSGKTSRSRGLDKPAAESIGRESKAA